MDPKKVYATVAAAAPVYDLALLVSGYSWSVNHFVSQLPFSAAKPLKILDAGCGTGPYSFALLKKYPRAQIVAFDADKKLIDRVRNKAIKHKLTAQMRIFTSNLQDPLDQIQGEQFDLIITSGVLEYVPLGATVARLSRRLKPDGIFLNSPVRDTLWGKAVCRLYACRPYSRTEYIQVFKNNGFFLEKIIKLPWFVPASFKEAQIFRQTNS